MKYKKIPNVGIASYPKEFKGLVVTPGKICIQFNYTEFKRRGDMKATQALPTVGQYGKSIPINTAVSLDQFAVGVPIEVHKELFPKLVEAYREYAEKFGDEEILEMLREI